MGIIIIPTVARMNSFDLRDENGISYDLDFPSILGKNMVIRIKVMKFIRKIQVIAT